MYAPLQLIAQHMRLTTNSMCAIYIAIDGLVGCLLAIVPFSNSKAFPWEKKTKAKRPFSH